ncbi:hypothetical protein ABZ545_10270 [Streptomyces abikoensis]|uniref:Uncharacterized protein n=1 Tax=Streptomyces abikoensis TaxID=97398 RepID=A0ABW7SXZ6_9ACTN
MISFMASDKMTDRQIGSAVMLGFLGSFQGTGLSGATQVVTPVRPEQRPTKGSEVRAAAEVQAIQAYALSAVANGAGSLNAAHHLPKTWAFRGLEPWRDPA